MRLFALAPKKGLMKKGVVSYPWVPLSNRGVFHTLGAPAPKTPLVGGLPHTKRPAQPPAFILGTIFWVKDRPSGLPGVIGKTVCTGV